MWGRLAWVVPVAMTAVVYYPITGNYFFSDDFLHFWQLVNDDFARFLLRMHGSHMYLTRNLVLASFYAIFGVRAAPYFWAALLTHLLNVFLLYRVVRRLTSSWRVACFSAALWGMAPVDEGSIGWFAVYGHVLAGTCTLWVLGGLAGCRAGAPMRPATPWLWGLVTIIGATCFGVGIGVALAMPAAAWLLLPPGRRRPLAVGVLAGAAAMVVGLYCGQAWLYSILYHERAGAGSLDLLADWPSHLAFGADLAGYGVVALLLGALDRPSDYPGPIGDVVIAVAALVMAGAVVRAPQQALRPLLACALLVAGVYGLIAAGRDMWVTPDTLAWMMRSARYHYVGTMMIAIALGVMAEALVSGWRLAGGWTNGALAVWAVATLTIALRYGPAINHFTFARRETVAALAAIGAIAAAAPPGIDVYIPNRRFGSIGFLLSSDLAVFPGWAAVFAIFHPDDTLDGHRVYFIVQNADAPGPRLRGRQTRALLRGVSGPLPDAPTAG